ncbi:nucleoside-triphosphate diphosphatase [Streptococcus halichoeri]|uniref:nucleoside-triphosphate diphosphatase n=1 Tax=Streptococcus halichoeri TaxID=254785 RepID=UPI0013598724|nr:nucleoside-triphosphate diphosphatase [Streptococcus halichoeri]
MMTTIYEYKDEENWFVGCWGGYNDLHILDRTLFAPPIWQIIRELDMLVPVTDESQGGFSVSVNRFTSDLHLFRFLLDMINHETKRNFELVQHQGAFIVKEGETIRLVHLPQAGLPSTAFLASQESPGMGDSILIATRNEGKTKEFRTLFGALGIQVENLNDYPELPEVPETGVTFEENARLKAETIAKLTQKMVLADDSGLKVDVLGGLPGVWSARFSGPDATDAKNNAKLLHELAMVFDKDKRSAQFHTTLVVAAPDRDSLVVEAEWPGYIATEPKGDNGFGYDPLFIVGEGERHAAELSAEEKNRLSHRGQAVRKLMEVFPAWQAKQS